MSTTLAEHVAALESQGYTVLDGMLTPAEIDEARTELDALFRRESRVGALHGWHNDTYRVAYMLPQKHPLFRRLLRNDRLLSFVRAALGPTCILSSMNGFTTTPGGAQQSLHIDQQESVPGTLLTINTLHVLDDFTRDNGCTRLVPGTHNRRWTGSPADVESAEHDAIYIEAPAGSLVAYSGGLWHASSRNRTTRERRVLHAYFARDWVQPEWDFPGSLTGDVVESLTEDERRLMGFCTKTSRYDSRLDRAAPAEPGRGGDRSPSRRLTRRGGLLDWHVWAKRLTRSRAAIRSAR
ncbi:MAG: phytanoyl-CoA dioxygenase family protein [Vicinamibacterales bacterium]